MNEKRNDREVMAICLGLIAAVVFVYWPLARSEFVSFDDPRYVTENDWVKKGLTWSGAAWAFRSTYASNWHPITWLSHMLDAQLYGMNPAGHHLTSLAFHAANAALLFLLLRSLTRALWPSVFVAALFALHPLHVESVAWIAERKDVLSSFFFLLALLAYGLYARDSRTGHLPPGQSGRPWRSAAYWLAVLLSALGLMSKPMLVTLPFVLLLLDYWPLERMFSADGPPNSIGKLFKSRLFWRRVIEKTPFFLMSAACSTVTFIAQKKGGAVETLERLDFDGRVAGALVAYAAYLEKTIWPVNLAVYYLRPSEWPEWTLIQALLILTGLGATVWIYGKSRPWLTMGWLWYLGMLVPVIGLVQVGSQSMADRYAYLPLVGIFVALAWIGVEITNRSPRFRPVVSCVAVLAVAACAFRARIQVNYWRNDWSLFNHCLKATENNFVAHNKIGVYLARQGRLEDAKAEYLKCLEIQPEYADAIKNMGILLTEQGDIAGATNYLRKAVRLQPKTAEMWGQLGTALALCGQPRPAAEYFRVAVSLTPDSGELMGKLAQQLAADGQTREAINWYYKAIAVEPERASALNNLAWILATQPDARLRNGPESVRLAERACALTGYKQGMFVGTLAAAYAEAGRFPDAISAAEKARALWRRAADSARSEQARRSAEERVRFNEELAALYRSGKAYRPASNN